MYGRYSYRDKHCRWCGKTYPAHKPHDRDGFCSISCKQAHYRAYKKYVTAKSADKLSPAAHRVTQKKPKRKKKDQ